MTHEYGEPRSELFDDDIFFTTNDAWWRELGCNSQEEAKEIIKKIRKLTYHPHGPAIKQLMEWRKLSDKMQKLIMLDRSLVKGSMKTIERINAYSQERAYKRWTSDEDEKLIDYVCRSDSSLVEAIAIFGRSPTAIKQRVSQLVGISRMSQEVAGRFIGTLDGIHIEGNIKGELKKQISSNS